MLPFQLPGFVAFGVQFDGLFQIFEGAILVSFQVLGTAPFGVCFAEIGFQINRFVEESNGFIQTFLRDQSWPTSSVASSLNGFSSNTFW